MANELTGNVSGLKLGDKVRLASGGPLMTLGSPEALGRGDCCWFVDGEYHEKSIPLAALVRADDNDSD